MKMLMIVRILLFTSIETNRQKVNKLLIELKIINWANKHMVRSKLIILLLNKILIPYWITKFFKNLILRFGSLWLYITLSNNISNTFLDFVLTCDYFSKSILASYIYVFVRMNQFFRINYQRMQKYNSS